MDVVLFKVYGVIELFMLFIQSHYYFWHVDARALVLDLVLSFPFAYWRGLRLLLTETMVTIEICPVLWKIMVEIQYQVVNWLVEVMFFFYIDQTCCISSTHGQLDVHTNLLPSRAPFPLFYRFCDAYFEFYCLRFISRPGANLSQTVYFYVHK